MKTYGKQDDSEVLGSDFPDLRTSAVSVTSAASTSSVASITFTASFHQKNYCVIALWVIRSYKWASQCTLIRLGSFDSSDIAFSPKKIHLVGFVGWWNKQIIILSFFKKKSILFYNQKSNNIMISLFYRLCKNQQFPQDGHFFGEKKTLEESLEFAKFLKML